MSDVAESVASSVGDEHQSELQRLRSELALLTSCGIVELAVRNPNVSDYMRHWETRAEAAEAKLAKAVEALEPSASTKAHYIGEFTFKIDDLGVDDDGDTFECQREVVVPWTTIKEIMAVIRMRATLAIDKGGE